VTPKIAAKKLQINTKGPIAERWGDCKIRIEVETVDIVDEAFISYSGKKGKEDILEMVIKDHPEFGPGGDLQFQSPKEVRIKHLEKWNHSKNKWDRIY